MPDPKRYLEDWSAITPTDFGLHAAYWTGKPGEPVTFRPILGWITYNAKEVRAGRIRPEVPARQWPR